MEQWIEKLKQFRKIEKTTAIYYTILKTLVQSFQEDKKMPEQQIFQSLLKSFPKQIKALSLYKQLVHQIWLKQYPIKVRQQCSPEILKAVTDWIMAFQIKIQDLTTTGSKFKFIREFLEKNCGNQQLTILIIDQIYEDLKDLFGASFWKLPEEITQEKQLTFYVEVQQQVAIEIISLLEKLVFRQIQTLQQSNKNNNDVLFYLSTKSVFATPNYYNFFFNCLNYLLCMNLSQSQQSQTTKLALQFMRNKYCVQNQRKTINLFKRLMLRTKKSVRYALVAEYVENYDFFHNFGCYQIIQSLEDITYFRELIIGQTKMVEKKETHNLQQIVPEHYFQSLFAKAGSKQRVYFSVEDTQAAILKFQLILEQGMNINLKIFLINNSSKQILYHEQAKTQLRRLQLKIIYSGLYAIEFDNSYSWIHGKKISYNIHILKRVQLFNLLPNNIQNHSEVKQQ